MEMNRKICKILFKIVINFLYYVSEQMIIMVLVAIIIIYGIYC